MRAERRTEGDREVFLITDVEPALRDAVLHLAFGPTDGGYAQTYPAGHPHMDRIFANFERHIGGIVLQNARRRPVPWEEALLTFCSAVEGEHIGWWLTGSAALAVRGLPIAPGDLDLMVDLESAPRVEELMLDYLVEPPRPGFISATFTRSFPGALLEWCAGVDERADRYGVGDVGLAAQARLETVRWRGHEVRVPPLDLQLVVNERRGLEDRVRLIRRALGEHHADAGE